jgi:Flp pilus assembly pilin Flp
MEFIRRLIVEEEGQGFVEYALMVGLVALAIWITISASGIGTAISGLFGRVGNQLGNCTSGSCP